MSMSRPIFVGGFYKSGTSLLRALIAQSPNIAGGLETYWFALDWAAGKGRGDEPLNAWLNRMGAFFSVSPERMEELARKSRTGPDFLDVFMADVAASQGKSRWVEKTSGNCQYCDKILDRWPDAKIINIFRDPRDAFTANLEGFQKQGEAPWVESRFVETWTQFIEAPQRFKAQGLLTPENFLEVRYEALVLDIRGTMQRVAAFLGDEHAEAMSDFSGRAEDFGRVAAITGKNSTTLHRLSQPLTKERVGIWRRLSDANLKAMEDDMRAAGKWDLYQAHCFDDER